MKNLILISFILCTTQTGLASGLFGLWKGHGRISTGLVSEREADPVEIQFQQQGETLEFSDSWTVQFEGVVWKIKSKSHLRVQGDAVYSGDLKVGNFSADLLQVDFIDRGYHVVAIMKIRTDGSMVYDYVAQSSNEKIEKHGILHFLVFPI